MLIMMVMGIVDGVLPLMPNSHIEPTTECKDIGCWVRPKSFYKRPLRSQICDCVSFGMQPHVVKPMASIKRCTDMAPMSQGAIHIGIKKIRVGGHI